MTTVTSTSTNLNATDHGVVTVMRDHLALDGYEQREGWHGTNSEDVSTLCSLMSQLNRFAGGSSTADDNVFRLAIGAFGVKVDVHLPDGGSNSELEETLKPYPTCREFFFSLCSAFGRPDDIIWGPMEASEGIVGHGHPAKALRRADVRKQDLTQFVAFWWSRAPPENSEAYVQDWGDVPWDRYYKKVAAPDRYTADSPRKRWLAVLKLLQLRGANFSTRMLPLELQGKDYELLFEFYKCTQEKVYSNRDEQRIKLDNIKNLIVTQGARCWRPTVTVMMAITEDAMSTEEDEGGMYILECALYVQFHTNWPELLDLLLEEAKRYGTVTLFGDDYVRLPQWVAVIIYALGLVPRINGEEDALPFWLRQLAYELLSDGQEFSDFVDRPPEGYDAIKRVLEAFVEHYKRALTMPAFLQPERVVYYASSDQELFLLRMNVIVAQLVERLEVLGVEEMFADVMTDLVTVMDATERHIQWVEQERSRRQREERESSSSPPYEPSSPAYSPTDPYTYVPWGEERDPWALRDRAAGGGRADAYD
jgi:hypothetical protein